MLARAQVQPRSLVVDILQLEHFLAVVDERSFTRAAERLYRTQSALSQSIKKLEDEIGASLFARDLHDVSLTEAGKVLVDYGRRMINLRDEATLKLGRLKSLETGALSIAAHESAAVYLLPGPIRAYLEQYPHVKVGIYRNRLEEIPSRVMDRAVEVGFVKEEPAFRELQWVDVHSDKMVLIACPNHPLASRPRVCIRDLDGVPFVVHHLCSSTEDIICRLFEKYDSKLNVVAELWSFENIKTFVHEDVGLAIVPRITVMQELRDGVIVEIPVDELKIPRRTVMIFRPNYLSDSAMELIKLVKRLSSSRSGREDLGIKKENLLPA
jgi:DNA-binding transcriptional LysR family regulator